RGVTTGLITTQGFRDVLEIGRQVRPHLYDYTVRTPAPVVPRARRAEVGERIDAGGVVLHALDEAEVAAAADVLAAQDVQAIAICFLHSYLNDAHERRAAEIVRVRLPGVYVCTSSEVLPEFREYERFSTTAINAYIGPRMARYLERFLGRLAALGIGAEPYTVHSNGGLMSVESVRRFPVRCCLSGPAAGVIGAAEVAREAGLPNVITFDAGGTSTDVSLIERGRPAFTSGRTIADYPVRAPMVDVHVIGAGGGSIAWVDDAGALKVGPRSAGAEPGPVAYGQGGVEPTLTDANVVLRRLNPVALLDGRMDVDEQAAHHAIAEKIATPMGLSVEQAALGIIRIAVANMSRAIRSVSTEKGHDTREFVLLPFGGAGPLHAAEVAAECGIRRVLVPVQPGTMCARGILLSDVSIDLVRSELLDATEDRWPRIRQRFDTMRSDGAAWLDSEHIPMERRRFDCVIDARYMGQNHEVPVRLSSDGVSREDVIRAFEDAHRREHGYDIAGRAVEVVNCRLKAVGLIDRPSPRFAGSSTAPLPKAVRRVHFDDGWLETPVFDREMLPVGANLFGPAVIDEMSATTLLPPGSELTVTRSGNMLLEIGA
ncbi:MAG TPA: hydantoinase/oxoprolinase family protein, partial [Acetobacteraceae bacterium]|nr:hydantoinase/oxoprolinase family protein [Acetobacteraceae bacterium]